MEDEAEDSIEIEIEMEEEVEEEKIKEDSTPAGFELAHALYSGFRDHPLNH